VRSHKEQPYFSMDDGFCKNYLVYTCNTRYCHSSIPMVKLFYSSHILSYFAIINQDMSYKYI
jgi:hypothetical protein